MNFSLCSMVLHAKNERVNTHLFLACFLSPLCYEKYVEENKEKSLVEYILRCSLKVKSIFFHIVDSEKVFDTIYTEDDELHERIPTFTAFKNDGHHLYL